MKYPIVSLSEALEQDTQYVDSLESRSYPKLSVKLYGRGVVPDPPVDGASVLMKRHQLAKSGQVILSEIWGKKGAIGLVPAEGDGALVTSHFFLFDVRSDRADPRYIDWILRGNYLQPQLEAEAKGTTGYAAVRPKYLLSAQVPLPPLPEQHRIVARIDELAAKIEESRGLRRQAVEEAEAFLPSMMRMAIPKEACAGWERLTVEQACEAIIDYRGRTPPIDADGIPHLTSANIRNGQIDWRSTKYVSRETYRRFMTRGIPKPGDVIFTMEAPLGEAAVVPDERMFSLAQRTLLLRGAPNVIDGDFLALVLASPDVREAVYKLATGTTVKGIASKRLRQVILPIPQLEEQRRAVTYLQAARHRIDTLRHLQAETAAELDAMLPAVLDRAFKGEL